MSYYQPPKNPQWSAPQPVPPSPGKSFHQRGWVRGIAIGLAAFALGAGIGASSTDVTASPEFLKMEKSNDQWQAKAQAADSELTAAQSELETVDEQTAAAQKATEKAAQAAADAQAMKVAATAAKKKADKRLSKLSTREASLNARESDMDAREANEPVATIDNGDDYSDDGGGTDPQFGTCGEANDNGYGPYVSGVDPEYDWYIDRDGDGVNCES